MPALRHSRTGWWLEEAGPVEPASPLVGDVRADVAIVGGGYLGLWTAWHVKQLEPGADVVVLDAELCGQGPSGRNGGFVSTLWGDLPTLRERVGDARAVEVCRASADAVRAIGSWCERHGVEAWYRPAPQLEVATTPAQLGAWRDAVHACAAVGATEEYIELDASAVRSRCDSPIFLGGALVPTAATVQPARLVLGLRAHVRKQGVRLFERSRVIELEGGLARTNEGAVTAGSIVLAVNSAAAGLRGYRLSLAVASSHIVLTEPVPDVLDDLGWTGGEAISDCRTLLHYLRTTNDGRIAFGWAGGRMGRGGRPAAWLDVDPAATRVAAEALVRFFPQAVGRQITHAWGGPIDVSPTHLPIFGTRGRVHHGFGFTGNGVGPTYLGGQILARLALDRRDALTRLAVVEPERKLFPPEPLRWAGGSLIRAALVRKDRAEDSGRRAGPLTAAVAGLPRRLGLRLPR